MKSNNIEEEKGFDRLIEVSNKRAEWATLALTEKLKILEEILVTITKEIEYDDWKSFGKSTAEMMGYDTRETIEGDLIATKEVLAMSLTAKTETENLIMAYKIRAGLTEPPKKFTKGNFETRTAINGQVVVKTHPIIPEDKAGFLPHFEAEVWMDASKIKDASQVEAFAFDKAWEHSVGEEGGLMMLFGAGNQAILTFVDIMEGLFKRNYVGYVKQHPIRNFTNDFFSRLMAPLISRGYLAIEAHTSIERASALVYHPLVDAFHITGGKSTHDLLVWGADPKEREENLKANTPKIKVATSELGAVSPWVVVPGNYTTAEMKSQVAVKANFIHSNASCNCMAPKCIVVADEWDQKDEYLQLLDDELAHHSLPVAYYPGIQQRWEKFSSEYPDSKKIESKSGMGITERKLSAGGVNKEALLLPYIKIETEVDLKSDAGKEAAKNEYIFNNEPFSPVYAIITLKDTSQTSLMEFAKTASTFCNDYLFGTLSGSITTPPSLLENDSVQTLIAEMKYGCVAVNNANGLGYVIRHAGMWGAFPGETLDAVKSGIGKVGNVFAIPYFEKMVYVSPIIHPGNLVLEDDFVKDKRKQEAASKYFLYGGVGNFIELISAATGVELVKVGMIATSIAVAAGAYLFRLDK